MPSYRISLMALADAEATVVVDAESRGKAEQKAMQMAHSLDWKLMSGMGGGVNEDTALIFGSEELG